MLALADCSSIHDSESPPFCVYVCQELYTPSWTLPVPVMDPLSLTIGAGALAFAGWLKNRQETPPNNAEAEQQQFEQCEQQEPPPQQPSPPCPPQQEPYGPATSRAVHTEREQYAPYGRSAGAGGQYDYGHGARYHGHAGRAGHSGGAGYGGPGTAPTITFTSSIAGGEGYGGRPYESRPVHVGATGPYGVAQNVAQNGRFHVQPELCEAGGAQFAAQERFEEAVGNVGRILSERVAQLSRTDESRFYFCGWKSRWYNSRQHF